MIEKPESDAVLRLMYYAELQDGLDIQDLVGRARMAYRPVKVDEALHKVVTNLLVAGHFDRAFEVAPLIAAEYGAQSHTKRLACFWPALAIWNAVGKR